jgi:hypothetical protein
MEESHAASARLKKGDPRLTPPGARSPLSITRKGQAVARPAKMLTRDEARRTAYNVAKMPKFRNMARARRCPKRAGVHTRRRVF